MKSLFIEVVSLRQDTLGGSILEYLIWFLPLDGDCQRRVDGPGHDDLSDGQGLGQHVRVRHRLVGRDHQRRSEQEHAEKDERTYLISSYLSSQTQPNMKARRGPLTIILARQRPRASLNVCKLRPQPLEFWTRRGEGTKRLVGGGRWNLGGTWSGKRVGKPRYVLKINDPEKNQIFLVRWTPFWGVCLKLFLNLCYLIFLLQFWSKLSYIILSIFSIYLSRWFLGS